MLKSYISMVLTVLAAGAILFVVLILVVAGLGSLYYNRNVIDVDESVGLIQRMTNAEHVEVLQSSEVSFWGNWHEVRLVLEIDGELNYAKCSNDVSGPTTCLVFIPNDARLLEEW